eukprot:362020-Chlamydomonas_euryale.AAC.6
MAAACPSCCCPAWLDPPMITVNVHVWRVMSMAALDAKDASHSYMWAKHRSHPTPGLPPGQTIPLLGPEPTGAHAGQAARGAVAVLHAKHSMQSFVHAHDTPLTDLASSGPAHLFVCVANARLRASIGT